MRRKTAFAVLTILLAGALFALAGCTVKAETIQIKQAYYTVKVGESILPEIEVFPAVPYRLETAFAGIAEVADLSIVGVNPGITVLTARAGALTASVPVEVLAADGTNNQPGEGKATVLYVIDEASNNYYTNYVRFGETTPDLILEKNGYRFQGWYQDSDYRTAFDFKAPINADVRIYGKYAIVEGVETPLSYRLSDGNLLVTGVQYKSVPYTAIEIPEQAEFEGNVYSVAGVDASGLAGLTSLRSIKMPHIRILGDDAFKNCFKLAEIEANENLAYVGYNVFDDTAWFKTALQTRIDGYYHGAQLGNCYVGAQKNQNAVYLFTQSKTTVVTLFAGGAFAKNTNVKIRVPQALYAYYRAHPNLTSLVGQVVAY